MYCRVIACDFDGTGATDGHLAPEVQAALHAARDAGIVTLLVTGRVLDDLRAALVDFTSFDAVVAENGAVVWLPADDRMLVLGTPPDEEFLGRLRQASIPFHAGAVVIGTWEQHARTTLELVRTAGVDLQLTFNRGALMLLPSGANKATGTARALAELRRSPRNMVAFGDAENDLPLFAFAEVAVAARGSVPAVVAVADDRLTQPGAAGVAYYLDRVAMHGGWIETPVRRQVVLGVDDAGAAVTLPAGGAHVLVSGDPRSGKSWLAGLAVERLLEEGYRVCILDPEGDHAALAQRPGVLALGRRLCLPPAEQVTTVLRESGMSLVLDLNGLSQQAKCAYVAAALVELTAERATSGLPHWIVVDEAHYFFPASGPACAPLPATGNLMLVTYRPSLVATALLQSIGAFLVTRTVVEEERYFVDGLLRTFGPADVDVHAALQSLEPPRAGLLLPRPEGVQWRTFLPGRRLSRHAHHARKYADSPLPEGRGFYFRFPGGAVLAVANSVTEFQRAITTVPLAALRHHLLHGDFSRWARDVLGDDDLAAGFAKLEHTTAAGVAADREEILRHVADRYVL